MLAQGHTSAFISAETNMTKGAVKAHTARIHQKIGVHRKDEMLELLEQYAWERRRPT